MVAFTIRKASGAEPERSLKRQRLIQAPEPGVQYVSLVPVAIQTPAQVVEYIQLALQSATQGQKCTRTPSISHNDQSR